MVYGVSAFMFVICVGGRIWRGSSLSRVILSFTSLRYSCITYPWGVLVLGCACVLFDFVNTCGFICKTGIPGFITYGAGTSLTCTIIQSVPSEFERFLFNYCLFKFQDSHCDILVILK